MCAHAVILTPLPLPDLRVIEVQCVILMNKSHTDTLVKMREGKYMPCYCSPFMKQYVRNRKRQRQNTGCQLGLLSIRATQEEDEFYKLQNSQKDFMSILK